jgi:long-chain fatty acid transport protein
MRTRHAGWVTLLAGTLLGSSTVHAGGFLVAHFGGEHGNPIASNPTSIYYNPAGLAGIKGTEIYVEGQFAFRSLDYNRPGAAADSAATRSAESIAAVSGNAGLTNTLASPFAGVATNLGVDGLGLGLAFFVPFGGQAIFDKNDRFQDSTAFPGAFNGPQRWQDIEGTIRSLYVSAGGAYRFPFGLSIGAAVNGIRNEIDDIKAFNGNGTDNTAGEGRAWVNSSNTRLGFGVGIQFTPPSNPELTVGFSYQSQPGFGKTAQKGTARIKIGAAPEITPNVEVEQSLPDVFRLGISYRVTNDFRIAAWAAFERWSTFQSQCFINTDLPDSHCSVDDRGQTSPDSVVISNIPRNWDDVFNFRFGASYWVKPELELMAGLEYDGNAVPNETMMVDLPDFENFGFTVALNYALLEQKLKLYLGFTQFVYLSRDIPVQPRDLSGTRVAPYTGTTQQPDNAGHYHESVSLITFGVSYTF